MAKVILNSWKEDLQKIALTKLQVDLLGESLLASKRNVDALLAGQPVVIEVEDWKVAHSFLKQANRLGAGGEVDAS